MGSVEQFRLVLEYFSTVWKQKQRVYKHFWQELADILTEYLLYRLQQWLANIVRKYVGSVMFCCLWSASQVVFFCFVFCSCYWSAATWGITDIMAAAFSFRPNYSVINANASLPQLEIWGECGKRGSDFKCALSSEHEEVVSGFDSICIRRECCYLFIILKSSYPLVDNKHDFGGARWLKKNKNKKTPTKTQMHFPLFVSICMGKSVRISNVQTLSIP